MKVVLGKRELRKAAKSYAYQSLMSRSSMMGADAAKTRILSLENLYRNDLNIWDSISELVKEEAEKMLVSNQAFVRYYDAEKCDYPQLFNLKGERC